VNAKGQKNRGGQWLCYGAMAVLLIAAPASVAALQGAPSRSGTITGRAVDAQTGAPADGVHVLVEGTRLSQLTDRNGAFQITGVPAGRYTLFARKLGFTEARQRVSVVTGEVANVTFSLSVAPISLAGLVVEAESELATETSVLNYPAARVVVSVATIQESGALYTEEVLRKLPGIYIQDETGTGSKPNIGVRGLDPRRSQWVAILVDDVPIEPAPYGFTGLSIFPYLIERTNQIDVLRGGVAVRHGPNTVGGVIDLITTPIPMQPTLHIQQALGSNAYWSNHISAGTTAGSTGVLVDFANKRSDGFRDGTSFEMYNYNLKLRQEFSPSTYLTVGADGYNEPNTGLAGGMSLDNWEQFGRTFNEHPHDFFDGHRYGANAKLYSRLGARHQLRLLAYGYETERRFGLDRPGGTAIRETPRWMRTMAIEPRYSLDFGARSALTVGVRALREDANFWTTQYPIDTQGLRSGPETRLDSTKFSTNAVAVYVDSRLQLTERLLLYPGLRVEMIEMDADRLITNNQPSTGLFGSAKFTEYLPGMSASYRAAEHLRFFANYNRAFRAPQFIAIELNPERHGLQDFTAERSNNFEIGTRIGPSYGLYGEGVVFQIDFDNQVQRDPAFENVFRNIGRTMHRGIEARGVIALDELSPSLAGLELSGGYTFVDAEIRSGPFEGNQVNDSPRHRITWRGKYAMPAGITLVADGLHLSSTFSDAENTVEAPPTGVRGIIPSHSLFNAGILYDLPRWGVSLGLHGRNLTDEATFIRDSRGIIPGPGRTFVVQARTTLARR
jgi:Fe(3+) dicitrate transport protein